MGDTDAQNKREAVIERGKHGSEFKAGEGIDSSSTSVDLESACHRLYMTRIWCRVWHPPVESRPGLVSKDTCVAPKEWLSPGEYAPYRKHTSNVPNTVSLYACRAPGETHRSYSKPRPGPPTPAVLSSGRGMSGGKPKNPSIKLLGISCSARLVAYDISGGTGSLGARCCRVSAPLPRAHRPAPRRRWAHRHATRQPGIAVVTCVCVCMEERAAWNTRRMGAAR